MSLHNLRVPRSDKPLWGRLLNRKDVLAGLLFMGIAILGLWVSRNYPIGTALRMSTGYVPRFLCWLLLLLGGAILVSGIRSLDADGELGPGGTWRPIILIPAALVAFGLSLERLGLVVACALLMAIASLADRDLRLREVVAAGAVLTLMTWAIFIRGLGLTIPVWPEW
jgi:putative tricarboxylic transport membrane protein